MSPAGPLASRSFPIHRFSRISVLYERTHTLARNPIGYLAAPALEAGSFQGTDQRFLWRREGKPAPETLPCLRHTRRSDCHEMPSMRSELDVRHGRGQPFAQPPPADYVARNVRNFDFELFAVRRELARYDSHYRISGAGWRGIFCADEPRRNRRSGSGNFRRVSAMAEGFAPAVAADYGYISSRQHSAHRIQHVGTDGCGPSN